MVIVFLVVLPVVLMVLGALAGLWWVCQPPTQSSSSTEELLHQAKRDIQLGLTKWEIRREASWLRRDLERELRELDS